jgi:hypothetical protein
MIPSEPLHASPGADLDYVVSLMNVPNRPFQFPGRCPAYEERIVRSHQTVANELLTLNCSVVGPVPGNTAVNFAMTIRVPSNLHGQYELVWRLDPPYGYDTKATLTVR